MDSIKNDIHPSLLQRKIIHVDMDAFYASVEVRDNPKLRGRPVVIGGSPHSRGVVCTASYEARTFGIRSAMACSKAFRLCPDAIFIEPNFEKYTQVSRSIRDIFRRHTPIIEPLSLDEAFLDVTQNCDTYAVTIGKQIQSSIATELQLSCSVGIAPNKLVAKIASDYRKPAGLTVVPPEKVFAFMQTLPVRQLFGVGPATEARLARLGIRSCADLIAMPAETAELLLGQSGLWLHQAAHGIDLRPVQTHRTRKSFGREETFSKDQTCVEKLLKELERLCTRVAEDLIKAQTRCRTVTLKIKYADFSVNTRSTTRALPFHDHRDMFEQVRTLLIEKTDAGQRAIRLVGVSASHLMKAEESEAQTHSTARLNSNAHLFETQTIDGWETLLGP